LPLPLPSPSSSPTAQELVDGDDDGNGYARRGVSC
jgi:hypothetical protein